MYARAVPTAHGRARVRTGAFSNYRAGDIVRGRLVTAQAARAGVPLVIVGAAGRRCWPLVFRRVLCVWVCAVCWLSVLGLVLVWRWCGAGW